MRLIAIDDRTMKMLESGCRYFGDCSLEKYFADMLKNQIRGDLESVPEISSYLHDSLVPDSIVVDHGQIEDFISLIGHGQ